MKKDMSVTKIIASIVFLITAVFLFSMSAVAVLRFDSYHTRVLFYFNEVNQRKEGVILAQKRQQSPEDEMKHYLFALLNRPANADMRPIFDGRSIIEAVHLLDNQSVVVLKWTDEALFLGDFKMDRDLVEEGLNFNFPQLKPFVILFEKGDAT